MNFPKNYYSLEFNLKENKMDHVHYYTKLKYNYENKNIKKIANLWIKNIKLNIDLNYCEKDNCIKDKYNRKIKFRESNLARLFGYGGDNLIIFNIIEYENKYWDLNEINIIINAFLEVCNEYNIDKKYIESKIKLINKGNIYTIEKEIIS